MSSIVDNSKVDSIIKEFLFHSLSEIQLSDLRNHFKKNSNNFNISDTNVLSTIELHPLILESHCPLGKDLPYHLKDLKNSKQSFVVFGREPHRHISKIPYSLD